MSLEECKRMAEKSKRENRRAQGIVEGRSVTVILSGSPLFVFDDAWMVAVQAYGATSGERFKRRESAEKYFEELVQKYNLREEAWSG